MSGNDIIKALDILCKIDFFGQRAGRELWNEKPIDVQNKDIEHFARDVAFLKDFFNQQQAEIKRLKIEKDNLIRTYAECQAEAVKEFANKVENEIDCQPHSKGMQESAERCRIKSIINNLLKETVGEDT